MNVSAPPEQPQNGSSYVQIAALSVAIALAVTSLAHLWLVHFKLSISWQSVLVGPYLLLIIAVLLWQAITRPQRRYKVLVTLLGFGIGAAAGMYGLRYFGGDTFITLSLALSALVIVAVGLLCTLLNR